MALAQAPRAAQILRVVHGHAGGALHERLDDQRRGLVVVFLEIAFQVGGAAGRIFERRFARLGGAPIRAGYDRALAQQRRVGVPKERHVGDRSAPRVSPW